MRKKLEKILRERPEALDAGDAPHGRKLSASYVLGVLPAHVHERLAAKADETATSEIAEAERGTVRAALTAAAQRRARRKAEARLVETASASMVAATPAMVEN